MSKPFQFQSNGPYGRSLVVQPIKMAFDPLFVVVTGHLGDHDGCSEGKPTL